jgi:hypothetical protein
MTVGDSSAVVRPARWVLRIILAVYLAAFAYAVWRTAILQPYSDMFDWVDRYYRFQANGDWAAYLLAPHNYHRPVWTFAILAADIGLFGGSGYPFIVVGVACLIGSAAVLAREATAAAPQNMKPPAGGLAAMLTLTAANVLDASVHLNTTYAHALVFSVLAIALAEPHDRRPQVTWERVAALACILLAAFGNAVGLVVFPVLAFAAVRRGEWRWLAAVLAAAVVVIGLYASGQPPLGGGEPRTLASLLRSGHLALSYLGLPWTRAIPALGWAIGFVGLVLSAAALIFRGGAGASRAERVAVMLILFSLGTAAMAALGRAEFGEPWDVPLRYAVFLAPMHVGLLMLALPYGAKLPAKFSGAVAMIVAAVLLLQQFAGVVSVAKASDRIRQMKVDFEAGQRRSEMLLTIHPVISRAEAIGARMRRDGLYRHEAHRPRPTEAP